MRTRFEAVRLKNLLHRHSIIIIISNFLSIYHGNLTEYHRIRVVQIGIRIESSRGFSSGKTIQETGYRIFSETESVQICDSKRPLLLVSYFLNKPRLDNAVMIFLMTFYFKHTDKVSALQWWDTQTRHTNCDIISVSAWLFLSCTSCKMASIFTSRLSFECASFDEVETKC